ncbi:hypothetical protein LZ32DRAFT_401048 [Colletotrichum eremochloae]|nr:hypothetical protein LZ32DRAFT_401048 [Colletotrichum eremochloae]
MLAKLFSSRVKDKAAWFKVTAPDSRVVNLFLNLGVPNIHESQSLEVRVNKTTRRKQLSTCGTSLSYLKQSIDGDNNVHSSVSPTSRALIAASTNDVTRATFVCDNLGNPEHKDLRDGTAAAGVDLQDYFRANNYIRSNHNEARVDETNVTEAGKCTLTKETPPPLGMHDVCRGTETKGRHVRSDDGIGF